MLDILLSGGLCGCIILLAASAVQLWQGRRRIRSRLRELEELRASELIRQNRLVELSRQNAVQQFEVDWLGSLSDPAHVPERIFTIFERQQSNTNRPAWFLNASGDVLRANNAARRMNVIMALTAAGLNEFKTIQTTGVLQREIHFRILANSVPGILPQLHVYRCGSPEAVPFYLCLSRHPEISGNFDDDIAQLARLCRHLPDLAAPIPSVVSDDQASELNLVRDMLELRTLTDEDFESPRIMLEEFLCRLSALTGFERASIYRTSCQKLPGLELLATGGVSVSNTDNLLWTEQERAWLEKEDFGEGPYVWQTHLEPSMQEFHELGTSLLVRGQSTTGRETWLLLTSRQQVLKNDLKIELAKWSAQFLPVVFHKAMERIQMEDRARRDGLTRLANRQTFDTELNKSITGCRANQLPCSLLLLDLDYFKSVNDEHGHLAGDGVLQAVASTIARNVDQIRFADRLLVARYGGEEFAVLLPEIPLAGAQRIAEQIRQAIETHSHFLPTGRITTTASIGVACLTADCLHPEELIQAADRALYEAKHAGRNCIRVAVPSEIGLSPFCAKPTLPLQL